MFNSKKIAAMAASLLICSACAVSPVCVYAEDTTEASVSSDSLIQSGDFIYSLTHDGKICIEDCKSTEESLVIPDTLDGIAVTELGPTAFGDDHENNPYTSITLPASIEYISDRDPFMYCTKLKEIKVADGNAEYTAEDDILYTKAKDKLVHYPCCKSGDSFAVPEGIKTLGTASIYNTKLKSVTFPSTLEEISVFAMGDTAELTSIDLSGTKVRKIDTYAFSGCEKLDSVKLPSTLEVIGGGAFANCKALADITFPEELKSIGQYAFMDTSIKVAFIPEAVEDIGYCAFGYYTDEEGNTKADENFVIVGKPVSAASLYAKDTDSDYEYQNDFTFMSPEQYAEQQDLIAMERVKSGDYEYSITSAGTVLTLCTSTEDKIVIPETIDGNTITMIYPACFSHCEATEIVLPDTITELREMAFYNCQNLKSITIPASVKTVSNNIFDNCKKLESVEFCGAETIGSQIFFNCESLKKVTVAGCLKEWKDDEPFIYCPALEEINVSEGDGNYSSQDGVFYNKDKSTLLAYPVNKSAKSFKAPSSVTEIGQSAFANANNLKKVELPNVKVINSYAFEGCEELSEVILSDKLTEIGSDAFYGCMKLKKLRVPASLETIGTCAFGYYHNDNATATNGEASDLIVDGFKLYAPKDSTAYKFAKDCGMTVITDTTKIFGKNMDTRFLAVICGLIGAVILAVVGIITGKNLKKKKAEKELAERKAKSAERRKQESAAANTNKEEEHSED